MTPPRLFWVWLLVAGTQGVNDGDMRLADGGATNQGRVEIFYRGQWGTVCDNLWDLTDASVVCRALGFENATQALGRAAFGQGSGPIMLDEVQCMGTEASLADCKSLGWLKSNCRHERDAGVVCTNGTSTPEGLTSPCRQSSASTSWPLPMGPGSCRATAQASLPSSSPGTPRSRRPWTCMPMQWPQGTPCWRSSAYSSWPGTSRP
ncbi:LGALS3BP isoform 2 [Pan troglodytes]|uniref:LGALS3BP isoform 2 n=3 Tax=Pan TaxID=9596 RepID=A0A6D2VTL6_PANTR|nr:LGALS3BP isoform 2 [Pan troglodytes]